MGSRTQALQHGSRACTQSARLLLLVLLLSHPDESHSVSDRYSMLPFNGGICGHLCSEQTLGLIGSWPWTPLPCLHCGEGRLALLHHGTVYDWRRSLAHPKSQSLGWAECCHHSSGDIICPFSSFLWQGAKTPYCSVTRLFPPCRGQDPHCSSLWSSPVKTKQVPRMVSKPLISWLFPGLCLVQGMRGHQSFTFLQHLQHFWVIPHASSYLEFPAEEHWFLHSQHSGTRLRVRVQDLSNLGSYCSLTSHWLWELGLVTSASVSFPIRQWDETLPTSGKSWHIAWHVVSSLGISWMKEKSSLPGTLFGGSVF